MANTVKCRFCKCDISKDSAYSIEKGFYYCNEEHYKLQENKIKYKAPREKPNGEVNERRQLTDYIQDIYVKQGYDKHFINWSMLTAQVKNMQKENPKLSYVWIRYVLWYMINIKEINLFKTEDFNGSILNLVPFYYIESYNYWLETKTIKDKIKNMELEDEVITIHKVKKENNKVKEWGDL